MAVRGTVAKEKVIAAMKAAFGDDWIGEVDKKYYVWVKEDGERLQIAITLTCPKNLVEAKAKPNLSNELDFEAMDNNDSFTTNGNVEENTDVSEAEKETLQMLLDKLGL